MTKKLSLSRETLVTLTDSSMTNVHGGTAAATIAVTIRVCAPAAAAASRAHCGKATVAAGAAGKWLADKAGEYLFNEAADKARGK